jgi:hypothetical protein
VRRAIGSWIVARESGKPLGCILYDADGDPLTFAVALADCPDPRARIVGPICAACDPHDDVALLRKVTAALRKQLPDARPLDPLHYSAHGGRA